MLTSTGVVCIIGLVANHLRLEVIMKLTVLTILSMILVGCGVKDSDKIEVVTSVYPAYDFSVKVASDAANVTNIMPSGADAHSFEPTPLDIAKIQEADVFVYHGLGLESWVDSVLESIDTTKVKVVSLSSVSNLMMLEEGEDDHGEHVHDHEEDHDHGPYDVHTWLSIDNAKLQVQAIKDALVSVDSDNKAVYESNFESTIKKLDELKLSYESLKDFGDHLDMLVDHKAYGYIANEYNIHQMSIIRGSLSEEPTAQELQESIAFIKDNHIESIFISPSSTQRVYDIIKQETGVTILPLHTIESLTKSEINEGMDYFSIMMRNLESLKEGFSHEGHNH